MFSALNAGNLVKLSMKSEPWGNISYQRHFMDDLAKKLNITSKSEWYKVTWSTLKQYGGSELLRIYDYSPMELFKTIYPEYPWVSLKYFIM